MYLFTVKGCIDSVRHKILKLDPKDIPGIVQISLIYTRMDHIPIIFKRLGTLVGVHFGSHEVEAQTIFERLFRIKLND